MDDQEMTARLGALINRGRFRKAISIGLGYVLAKPHCDDAHLWFQLSLAESLIGETRRADFYRDQALLCSNCTGTMRGDFFRDAALAAICRGDASQAKDFLDQAEAEVPEGDGNRQAAISMVSGRLLLLLNAPLGALFCFATASTEFSQMGESANTQWVKNNNFHTLRACAAARKSFASDKSVASARRHLYQEITRRSDRDPNRLRRYRAWVLCYLGRVGYVADRRVFGD